MDPSVGECADISLNKFKQQSTYIHLVNSLCKNMLFTLMINLKRFHYLIKNRFYFLLADFISIIVLAMPLIFWSSHWSLHSWVSAYRSCRSWLYHIAVIASRRSDLMCSAIGSYQQHFTAEIVWVSWGKKSQLIENVIHFTYFDFDHISKAHSVSN